MRTLVEVTIVMYGDDSTAPNESKSVNVTISMLLTQSGIAETAFSEMGPKPSILVTDGEPHGARPSNWINRATISRSAIWLKNQFSTG